MKIFLELLQTNQITIFERERKRFNLPSESRLHLVRLVRVLLPIGCVGLEGWSLLVLGCVYIFFFFFPPVRSLNLSRLSCSLSLSALSLGSFDYLFCFIPPPPFFFVVCPEERINYKIKSCVLWPPVNNRTRTTRKCSQIFVLVPAQLSSAIINWICFGSKSSNVKFFSRCHWYKSVKMNLTLFE